MDNNSTVDLLIEMARKKRDEAAARMAQSQLRCQETEKKMGLLDQYLTEYHTRQRGLACTDAILLSNYRAFLERLESAAARQQTDLLMARRNPQRQIRRFRYQFQRMPGQGPDPAGSNGIRRCPQSQAGRRSGSNRGIHEARRYEIRAGCAPRQPCRVSVSGLPPGTARGRTFTCRRCLGASTASRRRHWAGPAHRDSGWDNGYPALHARISVRR